MPHLLTERKSAPAENAMKALIIILIVIAVLILLMLFLIAPGHGNKETKKVFYHLNLAHRGLHTPLPGSEYHEGYKILLSEKPDKSTSGKNESVEFIPENSLAAFCRAAENGYGIELDIQLTKDEQVVVFHDDTLPRVCGVNGRVDDYTYEELCAFRLLNTDERIPLFSEVLAAVNGRTPLLVELKNGPKNSLLCEKGLALLRGYKGLFCIESFSPFIVKWFRKNAPDILRGQLSSPYRELRKELPGFPAFMLGHLLTNFLARPQFIAYYKEKHSVTVKLAEAMGAMKFVWTARPTDDVKKLESSHDSVIFEFYKPEIRY